MAEPANNPKGISSLKFLTKIRPKAGEQQLNLPSKAMCATAHLSSHNCALVPCLSNHRGGPACEALLWQSKVQHSPILHLFPFQHH